MTNVKGNLPRTWMLDGYANLQDLFLRDPPPAPAPAAAALPPAPAAATLPPLKPGARRARSAAARLPAVKSPAPLPQAHDPNANKL